MVSTRILVSALASACALCALTAAAPAAAEDSYFAAKLQLGVAGNVAVDAGLGGDVSDDAAVSYGGVFGYMVPLHEYFVLGAEVGLQSWQTEAGNDLDLDRNLLGDLSLVPQARLPVGGIVELYVALPIGIALDFFNGFDGVGVGGIASADVDPAIGLAFSALVGARITLLGGFGVLAEAGYSLHSFSHEIDAQAANVSVGSVDVDVKVEQFVVRAGVYF
jgi:hypothetical protein